MAAQKVGVAILMVVNAGPPPMKIGEKMVTPLAAQKEDKAFLAAVDVGMPPVETEEVMLVPVVAPKKRLAMCPWWQWMLGHPLWELERRWRHLQLLGKW